MSEESPPRKIVYFLGAGASNDSGFDLPTMQGFFRLKDIRKVKYSQLKAFIDKNFPKIPLKKINLEDVITNLELSIDRFGSFGRRPESKLLDARKQFDQLVLERLNYLPKGKKFSSEKFECIFQGLTEQDTIITLNYDLTVKRTLEQMKTSGINSDIAENLLKREHYMLHEAGVEDAASRREGWSNGLYLKLHGSLDWFQCPHRDCPNYSMIVTKNPYYKDDPMPCAVCGAESEIAIVPPIMNKSFDRWPKLGLVWRLAREELTKSTKVIFIGVSFAPSDYYLRWLIKSSFLGTKDQKKNSQEKKIIVVDKCLSVKKKIRGMVDIEPTHYSSIQEYIDR